MNNKTQDFKKLLVNNLKKYAVTYLFLAISVFFIIASGLDMNYICSQLLLRPQPQCVYCSGVDHPYQSQGWASTSPLPLAQWRRKSVLLLTINWRITGVLGILTAAGVTLPLAMFFGFLIGKLLNKMKGQETIGSLILGYLQTAPTSCCSCSSLER